MQTPYNLEEPGFVTALYYSENLHMPGYKVSLPPPGTAGFSSREYLQRI
jgi:hypothetical protein